MARVSVDIDLEEFEDEDIYEEAKERGLLGDHEINLSAARELLLRGHGNALLADIEGLLFAKDPAKMKEAYDKACDTRDPVSGRPLIV